VKRFILPKTRWLVPALLVVVVLLGLWLRASDLRADPPPDLSWSFAPYTDEGLNTYSARNLVLYGTWKVDDFFPFVVYPLVNFLVALVFRLFGIGFVQVKLVSLLAGLGSIVALYFFVRDAAGRLAGLLASLIMALSFPHVMYTRLGLIESVQILFLVLAGLFWVRGLRRSWIMILSGLFAAGTVLLVKVSAVFVAPVMLVMLAVALLDARREPDRFPHLKRGIGLFFSGVGAAFVVWFLAVFLPHSRDYVQYVLRHSFESPAGNPETLGAYLFNTFIVGARSRLFPSLAWTALAGFLLLPGFGVSKRGGFRYLFAWFLFGLLLLGYMNYRPPRYEIILIPPLIAAAAVGIARLVEEGTLLPESRPGWLRSLGWTIWLWPLATQLYLLLLVRGTTAPTPGGALGIGFVIAIGVGLATIGLARALRQGVTVRPLLGRLILAGILLVLIFRLDLAQFFRWFGSRTHDMVGYSQEVDELLPEDGVLGGSWAPALMMESRKRGVCITDWANNDDPVGRFGMTHLVSHNENDVLLLEKSYSSLRGFLKPVWSRPVRGTRLTVFELLRPDSVPD
jgi:4-amino-4-deoxy-L-arabinose transferase-like glycosyltransferase